MQISHMPGTANLKDWEFRLGAQVRTVELLGEVPIIPNECQQLGQLVGQTLKRNGPTESVRVFRKEYPFSLAVFLVAQGVHGYSEGGYWPGVSKVTGVEIDPNWAIKLGRLFEDILRQLGLPLFPDLHARRYVDLILVHGGIPQYCLDDFFANLLQPAVSRGFYAGMSAQELIDEWLHHASGRYWTDKPVLHFLQFGGKVAEDLVERCREMAIEYRNSRIVPDATEVGLPERVVEAYRHWIDKQGPGDEPPPPDAWRLHRPEVIVDPPGQGVLLNLPPQQVPATAVHAEVMWRLRADGREQMIPVHVRRLGFDLKTSEQLIPLSQPAACYEVSLLADGEIKRSWRFPGIDAAHPMLVVDADRGTLVSWQRTLPARCVGLLYPAHLGLQIEGEEVCLETWPRLPWGWSGYCGGIWDLSQASRIKLLDKGRAILDAELRPDELAQRPALVGGQLLTLPDLAGHTPVYQGRPPSVRVPLSSRRETGDELGRWRVSVRSKWTAVPELQITCALAELQPDLEYRPGCVDLPLSVGRLLGEDPCGNFEVRLRGPLGRDAELPLRMVPYLAIQGLEPLYLPDPQRGPQAIIFDVGTEVYYTIETQVEDSACRVERGASSPDGLRMYRVVIGPETVAVDLAVVQKLPSGDIVRVSLPIQFPRLRWALVLDPGSASREWSGGAIRCPVDTLLHAEIPCLLVDLPLEPTGSFCPQLALRLIDLDGQELQCSTTQTAYAKQRQWRFDLGEFFDTIRASRSPVLRLELSARGLPGAKGPLSWPVLSLTRALIAENVTLKVRRAGKQPAFELRWHEPTPVRNRCVRFWPIWRPWDPHFEQAVPDSAEGMLSFRAPAERLRSGKYRLEFLVSDPWVPQAPCRPPRGSPGTVDIELISPERQLEWLDARLESSEHLVHLRDAIEVFIRDLRRFEPDFSEWYKLRKRAFAAEADAGAPLLEALDTYLRNLNESITRQSPDPQVLSEAFLSIVERMGEVSRATVDENIYQSWWKSIAESHIHAYTALLTGQTKNIKKRAASISSVRDEVATRVDHMAMRARTEDVVFREQLSMLQTALQNVEHDLRQWFATIEHGDQQAISDNAGNPHVHIESVLSQLHDVGEHGSSKDPEMSPFWEDVVRGVAERAEPVEALARQVVAIQAHRTQVAQVQTAEQHFELLLERAAICHDAGRPAGAETGRQWCFEHLDEGTIPQILALVELVRDVDPATLRALQLKMFAASRIQRLMEAERQGKVTPEQLDRYLVHLPRSGLLPQATCKQLLVVHDDAVRLHAVQQLLRRGGHDGVEAVLGWVDAATMSDADAMALLSLNLQPALEYLQDQPDRPSARRLLSALGQARQDVLRVGYWVHCNFGWGIITQIEREDTGQAVGWCVAAQSRYRLSVNLRPKLAPETIAVSLSTFTAEFGGPGQVITCGWCKQFSSQQRALIRRHSEVAHAPHTKREAQERGGGLLRERFEKGTRLSWSPLEFSITGPTDELM